VRLRTSLFFLPRGGRVRSFYFTIFCTHC
jgi:hypothetical protein